MDEALKALQEIQRSLRGVQAQISSKKHGFKLPGMEEDEVEGEGKEEEEGELLASGGMSQRSPLMGEAEEEDEVEEKPSMDASSDVKEISPIKSALEPMEEDEVEEDEMGGKPKGKKPVAKLMAIKALINQPGKKYS